MKKTKIKVDDDEVYEVEVERLECCGIYEVSGLYVHPAAVVVKLSQELNRDYPMIVFHDRVSNGNGEKLCRFIRRHKLGKVTASKKLMNPNTNADIQMWIFYPDWVELRDFVEYVDFEDDDSDNPWSY